MPARDEPARLAALNRSGLLAPAGTEAFNRVAMIACRVLRTAGAAVSVFGPAGHQIVGAHGQRRRESAAAEECLEADTLLAPGPVVLVRTTGCAAAPLIDGDGHRLGWLTVESSRARQWRPEELETLGGLAALALAEGRLLIAQDAGERVAAALARSERHAAAAVADADRAVRALDEVQALAAIGSWEWDPGEDRLRLSAELCRMLGVGSRREPRTLTRAEYEAWFPLDQRSDFRARVQGALRPDGTWEVEHAIVLADGTSRLMISRGAARPGPGGRVDLIAGTLQDVTAARDHEARFRAAFSDAPIGVAMLGLIGAERGLWTAANPQLERQLGADRGGLDGADVADYTCPDDLERSSLELGRLAAAEIDRVRFELRLRRRDGDWVWLACTAALVRSADGSPRHAIAHYLDIGDRKRYEHEQLTHCDALTGLVNRGRLEDELDRALAHAARYASGGALIAFDLDGFQRLNDTAGHATADAVLERVARAVSAAVRASDTFARTGGDEFAILLPNATIGEARRVADKVLRIIRRRAHVGPEPVVAPLTASVGIAAWDARGISSGASQLLVDADSALYEAKSAGGDRFVVYAPYEGDDPDGL